jgi:hypothetical protein
MRTNGPMAEMEIENIKVLHIKPPFQDRRIKAIVKIDGKMVVVCPWVTKEAFEDKVALHHLIEYFAKQVIEKE